MKICVFGDIHGNYEQLLKLIKTDDFLNADLRVCVGDIVGLGPFQKECMDLISKYDCKFLMGNHEARMIKYIDLDPDKDPADYEHFVMNREKLKSHLQTIKNMPFNYDVILGNKKIRFTHYGWFNKDMANKDFKLKNACLLKQFDIENENFDYVFYGHIHSPSCTIENKTTFFNVGSLGLKSPGNYSIIEISDKDIDIQRKYISFDKDEFLKTCEKLNYPKWEQLLKFSFENDLEVKQGTILLTGGAGYIGTNVCKKLVQQGYRVVVADNFSNSKRYNIDKLLKAYPNLIKVYNIDLLNIAEMENIFKNEQIEKCIHLAGKKYVAESFKKEQEYYDSNVLLTQNLINMLEKYNVYKLVFSSSITVYGKTEKDIVDEYEIKSPLSPYAEQKNICEKIIQEWQQKHNADAKVLRLSNPVGADMEFNLGDDAINTKYFGIMPYIIDKAKKNESLVFNGGNHQTKDGTTIRDYIHIEDVANAFVNAVEYKNNNFDVFNIGSGYPGYSVLDILKTTEKIIGKKLQYSFGPKREGDVSVFISNNEKAKDILNFKVTKNLYDMVDSQVKFVQSKTNENSVSTILKE